MLYLCPHAQHQVSVLKWVVYFNACMCSIVVCWPPSIQIFKSQYSILVWSFYCLHMPLPLTCISSCPCSLTHWHLTCLCCAHAKKGCLPPSSHLGVSCSCFVWLKPCSSKLGFVCFQLTCTFSARSNLSSFFASFITITVYIVPFLFPVLPLSVWQKQQQLLDWILS